MKPAIYKFGCEWCNGWGYVIKLKKSKIVLYLERCNHERSEWELFRFDKYSLEELLSQIEDLICDVEFVK